MSLSFDRIPLGEIKPVIHYDWVNDPYLKMDLGPSNRKLDNIDLNDEISFTKFIFQQLEVAKVPFGVGGYAEKRLIYSLNSDLFDYKEEPRTIHLGIDIWGAAGTPIHTPLDAEVHSFGNNAVHGDYGPVIILKHEGNGFIFHTLYGHLSTESLNNLEVGKHFEAGEKIASFGLYSENFHWPPHLHFQAIIDMAEHKGDYPGVAKESESEHFLSNCPDPSILLSLS